MHQPFCQILHLADPTFGLDQDGHDAWASVANRVADTARCRLEDAST